MQEKHDIPATSASSRRASYILLEKGRAPRLLRESCARKALCLCRLAATHATKTRVPAPGVRPTSEKPCVRRSDSIPIDKNRAPLPPGEHPARQKTCVPARRGASCSREVLRPRRPARPAEKTLCPHGLGTRPLLVLPRSFRETLDL
jgi:hypothetical protein